MLRVSLIWKQFPDGLRIMRPEQIKHKWNEGRSKRGKNKKKEWKHPVWREIESPAAENEVGEEKRKALQQKMS